MLLEFNNKNSKMDNGNLTHTMRGTIDENNIPDQTEFVELSPHLLNRLFAMTDREVLAFLHNECQKKKKADEVVVLLC